MELKIIKALDNQNLFLNVYPVENPKGAIQVIHGMMEHQGRYEDFAKKMNEAGYTVITSDLRGHGKYSTHLGNFKHRGGYKDLLLDQQTITNYIENSLDIHNIILYGHSMGSIIARNLIQKESGLYSKMILSGFPPYKKGIGFGIAIGNFTQFFTTDLGKTNYMKKMVLGSYSKAIKDAKTELDWLSYNEDNVKDYINDPLCGFDFTNGAYVDLMHLVKGLHNKKSENAVNLPILLLYGEDDPCVGGEIGVKTSLIDLNTQGFDNTTIISYPHMRHEILKEKNNEKVYSDILNFIEE
ncbi:MAG: alpha/beta hydrolase [Acholeplasmatales bacterium]|nr:alpha/beta hydrolase [Acholeplasmatales bacterium]